MLIACSGGGDSVALAALVAEAGLDAELVHLDHGWREDSAVEGDFVRELGGRLGLPARSERLELPEGGNREAVAREARYEALARIAAEVGAGAVLTGHTAEDRAETLWLWLLRGTGPGRLAPMPASRPILPGSDILLVRPLLAFRREELRDLLRERGLRWLEDPSNAELDLRRNRVRHRLLPFLAEEFGVDPTAGAARLAERMGEILEHLDLELAARGLDPTATRHDRAALAALPPALGRHFLHGLLRCHGEPDAEAVERLLAHLGRADTGAVLQLPGGLSARLEPGELVLEATGATAPAPESLPQAAVPPGGLELPIDRDVDLPLPGGWILRVRRLEGAAEPPPHARTARFDLDALAAPLRLANPSPGMRIRLLGGPGEGKLSDLFIDRKVPRPYRAAWPLLLDREDRLLWAPALGRSELAPLVRSTRRTLCLDLEPGSA